MATTQASDLHFVVQRGDRTLDADLLALHGLTTHDIIVAAASVIAQGTTNVNDPIWDAADDMVRGTGADTAERFSVAASRIIGKAASGKVRDLTAAEAKVILALVAADISDFNTAVRTSSVAQLAAPAADWDNNGHKITGGGTPTLATDFVIKSYVDALAAAGQQVKTSCVTSTTANITLSGEQTIDGVLTSASRVLVKDQSTASQNGIYVSAAGAWSRATDSDTGAELVNAYVTITGGTAGAGKSWQQVTPATITIGSTSIVWNLYASLAGTGWTTTTVTANATGQDRQVVLIDATSADITVLAQKTANLQSIFKRIDNSAHTVTLSTVSGSIDHGASINLSSQDEARWTIGDGTAVWVIGQRVLFGSPVRLGPPASDGTAGSTARADHIHDTLVSKNTQVDNYTLVLTDADNKVVEMNKATGLTLTIPPAASVAWATGTTIEVYAMGVGQVTVTPGAAVTIRAPNGLKSAHQYACMGLRYRGSDEWVLSGDTTV